MEILRIGISKRAQSFKVRAYHNGAESPLSFTSINKFHVIASNHLQRPKELIDRSSESNNHKFSNFNWLLEARRQQNPRRNHRCIQNMGTHGCPALFHVSPDIDR